MSQPQSTIRRRLFGTPARRLTLVIITHLLFFGGGALFHYYFDHYAASSGAAMSLFVLWLVFGFLAAGSMVIALGERFFGVNFYQKFLKDEWAAIDARIESGKSRIEVEMEELTDDAPELQIKDKSGRLGLYCFIFAAVYVAISNFAAGNFLKRFTHPGLAIVAMRSSDPIARRQGLDMIAAKLTFKATPALIQVLEDALNDQDHGIVARAAHVAGCLAIPELAPKLGEIAKNAPDLTFATMIALGQIGGEAAQDQAKTLAYTPEAAEEPLALSYLLGLTHTRAIEPLRKILDDTSNAKAENERVRAVTLWALGELKEPRLLPLFEEALTEESLLVRCSAVHALEVMCVFESSRALQRAWAQSQKDDLCPIVTVPVQEGGPMQIILPYRNYQLALVRALSTTDDPDLIPWFEAHQDDIQYETHRLMESAWKRLKQRDERGELNEHRQKNRLRRLREKTENQQTVPDAGLPDASTPAE